MQKYQLENKEKIKKMQADYYAKNRQARIENSQRWYRNNHDKALETRRERAKKPKSRIESIRHGAKLRNIEISLTDDEIISMISNPCFYCGGGEGKLIGIDRIDNSIGYVKENCVPCCSLCNYMKGTNSKDDFISQCKKISSHIK